MHNMFHEDEVPSEFRCAVRQEGVVELSPMASSPVWKTAPPRSFWALLLIPAKLWKWMMDSSITVSIWNLEERGTCLTGCRQSQANVYQPDSEDD